MEGSSRNRLYARRNREDPLDRRICEIAERQHGAVAARQIALLGLSASALRDRVAGGRLHRVHAGVVALVPPAMLTLKGRIMAATLACDPGTAASHRASGALFELRLAMRRWIDVTTPGSTGRRRDGIRVHSGMTLTAADVTVIDNIPCTSLARTLLDIAEDATRREIERALDVAEQRQLLDVRAIDDVLARANGRRGARLLRAVLAGARRRQHADAQRSRGGVPRDRPRRRAAAGRGQRVDRLSRRRRRRSRLSLPEQRLIVEVDGRDVHATRRAFHADRRRDARLMLLGWRVVRFTWRQVMFEPAYVAATLRGLLDAPARASAG